MFTSTIILSLLDIDRYKNIFSSLMSLLFCKLFYFTMYQHFISFQCRILKVPSVFHPWKLQTISLLPSMFYLLIYFFEYNRNVSIQKLLVDGFQLCSFLIDIMFLSSHLLYKYNYNYFMCYY